MTTFKYPRMKRRSSDRPYDSGNSKVQAKLSRFFQAKDNANNISRKDDEAKSSLITSKSIQVTLNFLKIYLPW